MSAPEPPKGFKIISAPTPAPAEAPPTDTAPGAEQDYRKADWQTVVGRGAMAYGPDALKTSGQLIGGIAQAISDPVAAYHGMMGQLQYAGDVASGALHNIPGAERGLQFLRDINVASTPTKEQQAEIDASKKVAKTVYDTVTTPEGQDYLIGELKQRLATRPAKLGLDAATILYPPARGLRAATAISEATIERLPWIVKKGANAANKLGNATVVAADALNPITLPGKVLKKGGQALKNVSGVTQGTGKLPLEEAFRAGQTGLRGAKNRAFNAAMGSESADNLLQQGMKAVDEMYAEKKVNYENKMAIAEQYQAPLDFTPIWKAYQDLRGSLSKGGASSASRKEMGTINQIGAILNKQKRNPLGHNVAALDAIKQQINKLHPKADKHTPHGRLSSVMAGKMSGIIDEQLRGRGITEYGDTMKEYGRLKSAIDEMRSTFSLNDRASKDTAIRKLLSSLRDNVNTNFGHRAELIDALQNYGADHLKAGIAGHSLKSWMPQGMLARIIGGLTTGGPMAMVAAMNPATLAAAVPGLAMASPRLAGRTAQAAGLAHRYTGAAGVPTTSLVANAVNHATGFTGPAEMTPEQKQAKAQELIAQGIAQGKDPDAVRQRVFEYLKMDQPSAFHNRIMQLAPSNAVQGQ